MEQKPPGSSKHKVWRREAKKDRRKRVRQKIAQARDADDERLRATLERSANYTNWMAEENKRKEEREIEEQREHDENEKLWLEEELRAQQEWRAHQARKDKARHVQYQQDEIIRKEFEEKQEALRKIKRANARRYEEETQKQDAILKEISDYIDDGAKTPEILRSVTDSQPGKALCPFFTKTGACRYGEGCSRNHRRVGLSRVLLVPGFYNHFSLEKNSAEYDTDVSLEYDKIEKQNHFREFYDEVLPELESFGRITTLKFCCNSEIHLRGNMYVEYQSEREAARACRKLKGRYWAGRQLNCEFVNLRSWRDAVCGMNACPKGRACNFLHTFKSPYGRYGVRSPPRWTKQKQTQWEKNSKKAAERSLLKWDDLDGQGREESRNWRWSESPEPESSARSDSDRTRRSTDDRNQRRRGSRNERKREDDKERSSSRSSTNDVDSHRRKNRSDRSKRRRDDYETDHRTKYEEYSSRRSPKKSRRRRRSHDDEDDEEISHKSSNVESSESSSTRRSEKNTTDVESRIDSSKKKTESDENYDEISKEFRLGAISKARWDEINTNIDLETDVGPSKCDFTTAEEAKIEENSSMNEQNLFNADNDCNTTGSE